MKLKFNDIAFYASHGLAYYLPLESERFDYILEDEPFRLALPFMDDNDKKIHLDKYMKMYLYQKEPQIMFDDNKIFLGQMESSLGFEEDDVYLDEVKPILQPLSELMNDERTYNEINELLEINGLEINNFMLLKNSIPNVAISYQEMQDVLNVLYRQKYDINFLISKGLAMSTTKEFNPYK